MNSGVFFYNGNIYTSEGMKTWMLVVKNKIEKIGDDATLGTEVGIDSIDQVLQSDKFEIVDLQQLLVLPGLHDSHIHVYSLGRFATRLNLKKVGSIIELQHKIEQFALEDNFPWLIGDGWDQDFMEEKRYPHRSDIDTLCDKPMILYRACHHIALVNTKALEIMNISSETKDPSGGQIDRDPDGNPTGILRENALSLVAPYINPLYENFHSDYFIAGINECLTNGLTSVHTNDAHAWKYYHQMVKSKNLPIRVFLTIPFDELDDPETPKPNQNNGLLTCKRVKLFADGSLGAATAALRSNYTGLDHSGILIHRKDELANNITKAQDMGYQLEVHAIGDLAAEHVIEGFKQAGITNTDRAIITHCQVLGADLIQEMANNKFIANIQPPFVPTDALWAEKRLGGDDRYLFSYAWKTLLDSQVPIAGGSDSPIESANPFWGIYCAIKRPSPKGEVWKPKECLNFSEALDLYTKGGAYAVNMEDQLGELRPGYLADFVLVNPEIIDNLDLLKNYKPEQVWVDGKRRL